MMYRVKDDADRYLIAEIGPTELREVYKTFPNVKRILDQPDTNEPLKDVWQPLDFPMADASQAQKATTTPDIALWQSGLVLTPKALDCLHPHLAPFGEFLDATTGGQPMVLFNCLTFGKEDLSQTITEYIDGVAVGLEHLAFDEQDVEAKLVFKSKMQHGQFLFCGEEFKALCERNELKGLRFDSDLLSVF
ncbi:hypothetical protein PVT67_04335 [Gallaecimonas kandeliae]|uniref:hypothetical protein n=1 Tax=Gallaecimonas kandeliae TaxID=3029055 RepID=UPI002648B6DB|nr:hypothetical protein [Gallaecimonas kandeliae]WKE66484.1 hypothetical protein PVT67_04335 [Gallaecimonas kandeliae]